MATDPANPFDYYERIRSRQARGSAATDDPVMATVASIRAQDAKRAIMDAPDSPDEAARVTRIARAVGEPPAMIEGRAADYEKAQNADLLSNVFNVMPMLGQYFADNPRALVAAQDDHKSVGLLGRTLEFFKGIPGALEAGYERTGGGLSDLYQSIDEAILPFTNPSGGRAQLDRYERDGAAYRARAEVARPQSDNFVVQSALQGVESIPGSLAALVVGAGTRNPTAAASVMGLQTGAPAYREALRAGKDTPTALRYGFEQGAIEALTERLPAGAWLDALTKRTPAGQAILRSLATELPGEQVATVLQDFSTWATMTPDRPFSEYLAERPEAALRTAIATVTGTAAQVGATQVTAKTGDALVSKVREVRRARAHGEVLTRFEKAAAESKLRQRDGEAYAEMVGTLAAQSGIESVMVPAEAVREYMQSDGYDRFSDPFESYRDQVDEAFAVGGDVVLPADFALGTLPGTPAWSALRDDIRLTSGGMSPREAQSFDDAMADVVAEFEAEMQAEYADLNAQLDAQGKLLQSVRDKLMNAGFTPYAAAQQAELIARRITTRAARMGQEVTGGEFTTEVRQVLPPELAKARAADATDLVINALRRGKDATVQSGPSLLEWISKRGGINDPGGDLASMGLDQWRKGKPGKRKLVRKFDAAAAMGGVSGAGDYGIDTTLRAAIDAGFFPELMELENEAGPSQLDTQVLLDAMSAELAGSPRYASDPRIDQYRAAAAELDQMLTERGLDPAGMSDAELRAVIAQMDEAGTGGFEQLPDTIEIDGVQRPTRNSEGQPLAGSEAGVRAFWKWFGESKVVDAEGRPLVVYHGTNQPIDQFSSDRLGMSTRSESANYGFFFTSDPYVAGLYANSAASKIAPNVDEFERKSEELQRKVDRLEKQAIRTGNWDAYEAAMLEWETLEIDTMRADDSGQNIVPAYLAISDPVVIDFGGEGILKMDGGFGAAIKAARDSGKGGLFLKDIDDTPGESRVSDHYVAFSPTQIKSINNRGTFDPADPRILFQSPREYYQGGGQSFADGPRGRIRFEQVPVIELFQGRNLSTLLHELGHQYLEELRFDAESPDAPAQLVNDMETVKAWFAANGHPIVDGFIPVEAHEMWARGFERYLMEGKAPSSALARVFETLRGWMLSIYKKVEALRSPITPEIREVFDRLLATDEEIQAARESQALLPLFKDAAAVGMTGPEFEAYQAQFDEARVAANGEVLAKTMATIRRRVTAEYREQRAKVEEEVTARVDGQPLFKALRNLKAEPINADWLRDNMGEDVFSLLPKRVPPIWKDRGAHPDSVAEMSGYATGRQMVEALIGAELAHRQAKEGGDQRPLRVRAIQTETDAEMNAMVGDPLGDGTIEREALAAVNSEKQGEVMASELRAISRRTGQRPTPYKIARQWARTKVRQGAYNVEASPAAIQRHTRAVAKAGGEAERALMAGKFDDAFAAKQRQMLSSALLAEAKAAGDEVDAARKYLDRIASRRTMQGVDQEYLERAHELLEDVDLKQRSQKSLDRKESFEKWAAAKQDEGVEVVTPDRFAYAGKNWSRLSTEELTGLHDAVKSVIHLGRRKQTMLDNKERREFDEWRAEALQNLEDTPGRKISSDLSEEQSTTRAALALGLKVENLARELDNDKPGVWTRLLVDRATEAENYRAEQRKRVLYPIAERYNAMSRKNRDRLAERITVPEVPFRSADLADPRNGEPRSMSRWEIVGMALNTGTESNLDKLARGYGVEPSVIEELVNRELTEQDWQFVQATWDALETLWPDIARAEREMSGVEPERVEVREVATPFGTLRGGYYPVVYDPAQSQIGEDNESKAADDMFGRNTGVATSSGHTKARTGFAAPILLSPEVVLFQHVEKIVTRNAYGPWVRDVLKVMRDRTVRAAFDRKMGREYREMIEPWLRRQVRAGMTNERGTRWANAFLRQARVNMTVVSMGLRWSTGVAQTIGLANSAGRIGPNYLRKGMARMLRNPSEAAAFVFERSPEMEMRNQEMNRDTIEAFQSMRAVRTGRKGVAAEASRRMAQVQAFAFWHIGMIDRYIVSLPTWLGAYEKALEEGKSDRDASAYADSMVRLSQGSGREKDLSAIQSPESEGLRFFTMFYTPFNVLLNAQWETGRAAKRGDWRKVAQLSFWFLIATPLLDAMLAGDAPDDDDEYGWASWLARNISTYQLAGIPIIRDAANFAERKAIGEFATFNPGPIARIFDATKATGADAWDVTFGDGEASDRWLRNAIETPGYFLGLPTGQPAATAQFIWDVNDGKVEPDGFAEWYEGLTKGRIKED